MREYKDFKEFYNAGYTLAQEVKALTSGMTANQRVKFARSYVSEDILKSYIYIGILTNEAKCMLCSYNSSLRLSMDNLVKNIIVHSEMCFENYIKIPFVAYNPSKIVKAKNGFDIMLFKIDGKCYKLIIKTTKNKNENFVKSFHFIEIKRFDKY